MLELQIPNHQNIASTTTTIQITKSLHTLTIDIMGCNQTKYHEQSYPHTKNLTKPHYS